MHAWGVNPFKPVLDVLQVVRHSYEYHGLNDLFFFCITALAVTMVRFRPYPPRRPS